MNKTVTVKVKVNKTAWYYIAAFVLWFVGNWPLTITRVNGIKSNSTGLNDLIK
jgi:hypothetical protein